MEQQRLSRKYLLREPSPERQEGTRKISLHRVNFIEQKSQGGYNMDQKYNQPIKLQV